jgi:hypothetical protein
MIARLEFAPFGQLVRAKAESAALLIGTLLNEQKGIRQVIWLHDETAGLYGSLSIWDTREHAAGGWENVSRHVMETFGMLSISPMQPLQPSWYSICGPQASAYMAVQGS